MAPLSFSRIFAIATLFLHLCSPSSANPIRQHEAEPAGSLLDDQLDRRAPAPFAATGIQSGVYPRLEIRQLQLNTDQWNIYIQGLLRFQQTDQSALTSYYQVAGIHGRPYIPWDGVQHAAGTKSPGYCNHVINTFLPWHRPYVALYEQLLYQSMQQVVNEFPAGANRTRYAQAISTWRLPYWDWAAVPPSGQSSWPTFMQDPEILVTTPKGSQAVHNPLFSYVFHPVSKKDFVFNPFAFWSNTKRAPTSSNQTATSQNQNVSRALDQNRPSIQNRVYNLFVNYNNFTEFGDEAWLPDSSVSNADSLESVHDLIHALVGLNGHMTYFDYSAYDPAFFLHHANVDRLFTLWQVLYPDSYLEPMQAKQQTYTYKAGDTRDVNSALEPFYSSNGTFWTAATARNTTTFGYTYPEIYPYVNVASVKTSINNLYGPNATSNNVSRRSTVSKKSSLLPSPPNILPSGASRQYTANIRSPKTALNGSYAIYVFLGPFDETDPSSWPSSPNLAGTQAVFAGLNMVDAASGPQVGGANGGVLVSGTVPLTDALLSKVGMGELENLLVPSVVEEYLRENLRWRVATFNDCAAVPSQDVPGLQVVVVSSESCPSPSPDEFPVLHNFVPLEHITGGQPGGAW